MIAHLNDPSQLKKLLLLPCRDEDYEGRQIIQGVAKHGGKIAIRAIRQHGRVIRAVADCNKQSVCIFPSTVS